MRKIYWAVAGSIGISCLILQSASVLAETSLRTAVSSEQVVSAKSMPTGSSTAQSAKVSAIEVLEPTPAPSFLMVQSTPNPNESQITSVSQLSDVQPQDWAILALQSLIERYGSVAGYPNSIYRGNRVMTRYEFASGLSAVLIHVNELIATGVRDQVSRDDLTTLQRLQQEFAPELASLQDRINSLEARSRELEANQFSTTTNFTGQVIFAVNKGGFNGDHIVDPTGAEIINEDPNATFLYRAALDFNTSFSGTDLLKIRLDTGSDRGDDNAGGFLEPTFGSVLDFSVEPPRSGEIGLGRLYYTFTAFDDFSVTIGPAIIPTDYVDTNSYANLSQDFTTQALVNNYILFPINGLSSGALIDWNPGAGFKLRAMYVTVDALNPDDQGILGGVSPLTRLLFPGSGGNRGLFRDPNQGTVELEYAPSSSFALRIQYSGGNVFDGRFDVLGANFELALSREIGVFGRYGYGSYDDTAVGDINPNYWMAGVAFRNILLPGTLAGVAAGQPFIDTAVGNRTQTNIEAFYNFPFSDNIQVTPLVQVIANPANQDNNGTIVTGTLRTVFSF